jgi:hypothetical protein
MPLITPCRYIESLPNKIMELMQEIDGTKVRK